MKCPHCSVGINLETEETSVWPKNDVEESGMGYDVSYGHCPECQELIVSLRHGKYSEKKTSEYTYGVLNDLESEEIIYPRQIARKVEAEVPERFKKDFVEACAVLPISPKASPALSRRILQDILREQFKIKHPSLANEIDDFINLKDVPSYLTQAVDAVRNVGNFAAHPTKDTNTGEVVEVEPGEAEWLLDVIEALFDFAFVQPIRLEERKQKLNQKLQAVGKPPMKSKKSQQRQNKALHPTAYSFGFALVPRSKPSLPAAGELNRCAVACALTRHTGYEKRRLCYESNE
jgi:hypothetical protein